MLVARHRTALKRKTLSRPIRLVLENGLLVEGQTLFDYGCGHGGDISTLRRIGIPASGWDPTHRAGEERQPAEVVNLGYVVNVIECPQERAVALRGAWALAQRLLVVSAQLTVDAKGVHTRPYADGCITGARTFQKYYHQSELKDWVDDVLGVQSVAAAPGVFLVFRDSEQRQSFVASRFRRRSASPRLRKSDLLFQENEDQFKELMEFLMARGRLPAECECAAAAPLIERVGSLKTAYRIIQRVTGTEEWSRIRYQRAQDLLVHLALAQFEGRPRRSELAPDLALDVMAFFGSYREACRQADELLYSVGRQGEIDKACASAAPGKLLPTALYVHVDAVDELPSALRVYEGCARAYVGAIDQANVVKLSRRKPKISYLVYPEFEKVGHPTLAEVLVVNLQVLKIQHRSYIASSNPPILHRKEDMVRNDHPGREKFARLTSQEERAGLYQDVSRIGFREEWEKIVKARGYRHKGHRLVRERS
jgi:DNA phosphorothioation-associated putative methyltransferase